MKYGSRKAKLNSIFIEAAYWDKPEEVFLAMVKGADMNTVSPENGYNAFHWALHNVSTNLLKVLIDYESNGYDRKEYIDLPKELIAKHTHKFGGEEKLKQKWQAQTKLIDLNHVNYDRKIARDCFPPHLTRDWQKQKSKEKYMDLFGRLYSNADSIARERFISVRYVSHKYKNSNKDEIKYYKDYDAL